MDDPHAESQIADSDKSELLDRLSKLPDSLILTILSLLPMRDVVQTTILSKRWKDLWTTVPCLHFCSGRWVMNLKPFQRFVSGALALWKGAKILKLSIYFMIDPSLTRDLDSWVHFAIERQVEELQVNLVESVDLFEQVVNKYDAPPCLYSCSSVTKLSLINCGLEIGKDVQWNHLKSLTIESNKSMTQVVDTVISGAPELESLSLIVNQTDESLNIQCTSLKVLKIHRSPRFRSDDDVSDTMLRIWAPNLETFEISGVPYTKCLFNFPSLTSAVLDFRGRAIFDDGVNSDFWLDEMAIQVILSISDVEKITLSDWCIKTLLLMKKKDIFVEFPNAVFVKLIGEEAGQMLVVLDLFPNMMMLIFELDQMLLDFVYRDQFIFRLSDLMPTESPPTKS